MNENYTDISFVIDRSGSMSSIARDMEGGINNMLAQQDPSTDKDKCIVSIYQFDTQYEAVSENQNVQNVRKYSLDPRGGTALLDAVGETIKARGQYFASLPEKERPGKVIMVIVTDGYENSSRKYTRSQIGEMVKHQKNTYSWEFVFIGAGLEKFTDADDMQFKSANAKGFEKTSSGIYQLSAATGQSLKSYRGLSKTAYDARVADESVGFFEE